MIKPETSEMLRKRFHAIVKVQLPQPESLLGSDSKIDILGPGQTRLITGVVPGDTTNR